MSDKDVPYGLPVEYHDAIKWRAVMMVYASDNALHEEQGAKRHFDEYMTALQRRFLPEATLSPAIA